jgi:tRNA (guanine6-N2)-methyltransferase
MRPCRYLITCPAGLEALAERELMGADSGVAVDTRLSGLLSFKSTLSTESLLNQRCASNLFRVLAEQGFPAGGRQGRLPDPSAALLKMLASEKTFRDCDPEPGSTFRIMLSSENSLIAPEREALARAEEEIRAATGMKPSRAGADAEFWLLLRNEGRIYFCRRLSKRRATERDLEKGELKPEIAHALCLAARLRAGDRVLDPFCGSGAIPLECLESRSDITLTAGDVDGEKISRLKARVGMNPAIRAQTADFLAEDSYAPESFDLVLTDPPWGSFKGLDDAFGFYSNFVQASARVLAPEGRLVFLSGAKAECEAALGKSGTIALKERFDILVSGRKAALWVCVKA